MSVMSAAEARQGAGASPEIPPRRLRIAASAPGRGDADGAAWNPQEASDTPSAEQGAAEVKASAMRVTQVRVVREVSVRTLRASETRSMTASQARAASQARVVTRSRVTNHAQATRHVRTAEPLAGRPRPVRLTRRGRRVVAGFALAVIIVAVTLLWMSAAGSVQASSGASATRSAYRGMTQVVVQPGQTLWSIAAAAEPSGNSWAVVQQIIDVNALNSADIQAGELLWVPKS